MLTACECMPALRRVGFGYGYSTAESPSETSLATMEAQWSSYVEQLQASGALSSALAVCDVSASMSGEPMEVMGSCSKQA